MTRARAPIPGDHAKLATLAKAAVAQHLARVQLNRIRNESTYLVANEADREAAGALWRAARAYARTVPPRVKRDRRA